MFPCLQVSSAHGFYGHGGSALAGRHHGPAMWCLVWANNLQVYDQPLVMKTSVLQRSVKLRFHSGCKGKSESCSKEEALLAATNGILEPNIWKIGDLMEFGGRLWWICAARTSREEPSRRATREGEAEDEVKHTTLFISFVYFLVILWIILHTMIYNVCRIYMNSYYYNCIFCHYPSLFSIKWMLRCFLPPTWPGLRSRRDLFASGPLIADLPSDM